MKLAEAEAWNERFPPKAGEELKDPEAWKHHEVEFTTGSRESASEQLDDNGDPIEPENPVEPNPDLNSITPENWSIRAGARRRWLSPLAAQLRRVSFGPAPLPFTRAAAS